MALKQARRCIQIRACYVNELERAGFNISRLVDRLVNETIDKVECGAMSARDAAGIVDVSPRLFTACLKRARAEGQTIAATLSEAINAALDKAGAP